METQIETIAPNGSATVRVKGHVIKVTREEYETDSPPAERDAAIIRAAQYKLNFGDD